MNAFNWRDVSVESRQALLKDVVTIAVGASDLLMKFYQSSEVLHTQYKDDASPVTAADLAAHRYIEAALLASQPHVPVVSEESVPAECPVDRPIHWLVDPLDGTKEFIHRTAEFTVNIALVVDGLVVLSVLAVPPKGTVYAGVQGGAGVYRVVAENWQLLQPSKRAHNAVMHVAISRRATGKEKDAYAAFFAALTAQHIAYHTIEAGSAYKFCLMLEGEVDVYPRLHPTCEWDTAAGQGLLELFGGGLVDLTGRAFTYNQRNSLQNGPFIAFRQNSLLPFFCTAGIIR